MDPSHHLDDIEFGGPATYRIVAQGALEQDWGDRLAGMRITTFDRRLQRPYTVLLGPIRDQAELSGVLATLHALHLPILRVERVERVEDES
jgi:hypothetical protein